MLGVPTQCVVAKKAGIGFPARGRPQCERGWGVFGPNVGLRVGGRISGSLPYCSHGSSHPNGSPPPPPHCLQTAPTWP